MYIFISMSAPPIPTKPKPVTGCSSIKADMVFAVDTSTSVGEANFNLTKVFLLSMMEKLDFSKINVAVIKFNDDVRTEFNLNSNKYVCSIHYPQIGVFTVFILTVLCLVQTHVLESCILSHCMITDSS